MNGDLSLPRDQSPTFAGGMEYSHPIGSLLTAALRGGYNTRNQDPEGLTGLSLGAGLAFKRFSFDFAWVPFGDLGDTFRYSLLVRF